MRKTAILIACVAFITGADAQTISPPALNNVTNDAQTKAAIMPNTAPSAGQVPVGNAGGTAYAPTSLSQDCTLASTGVITCLKTNNVAFGYFATGTDASHLTGTVANAQMSGSYTGITGLGTLGSLGLAGNLTQIVGGMQSGAPTGGVLGAGTINVSGAYYVNGSQYLGNVTNDAQTKAAVMPNTAPSAGQVPVGNAGGTAYAPTSLSQDCTLASTGVITCLKTNNVSFGSFATKNLGSSAALSDAHPTDPTGTNSTTGYKMMGLGSTCTITPTQSGRVMLIIGGQLANGGGGNINYYAAYGSGAAPANGAAASGAQFGAGPGTENSTVANYGVRTLSAVLTGLTLSTAYWFDIALQAISAGTVAINNVHCSAIEIP